MAQLYNFLFKSIDNSALVVFRIGFGLLLAIEGFGAIATGWVRKNLIEPEFTFSFIGLEWLQPLPGNGMYWYYAIMGVFGLMTMVGYRYRVAMFFYFLMWTGTYLMQKTSYNNHYYLMVLLTGAMVFMPAHRYASLDVRRNPSLQSRTCPNWCIWFFIGLLLIVYSFASLNKIYPDWLAARPIEIWFSAKKHYPIIGELLQEKWLHYCVSYGGILFDGLIIPLLLWKRTRWFAFGVSVCFHLFNSIVFGIGIFPYMMILSSVLFFPPEQVGKVFLKRKETILNENENENERDAFDKNERLNFASSKNILVPSNAPWVIFGLGLFFLVQILLPLRHHLYPDSPNWTEEGHRMAWRMMLRTKYASIDFKIIDNKTKEEWRLRPREFLTQKQARKIGARPDMCWQFVQYLKDHYKKQGRLDVSIYANSKVTLNGNRTGPLIKPDIDLARVEWKRFQHSDWLVIKED